MTRESLADRASRIARKIDELPINTRAEIRDYHRNATQMVYMIEAGLVAMVTTAGMEYIKNLEKKLESL